MVAANDKSIRTYGSRTVNLKLGQLRFSWKFVIAKTPVSILGADFLLGNAFAIDLKHWCLLRWRKSNNLETL